MQFSTPKMNIDGWDNEKASRKEAKEGRHTDSAFAWHPAPSSAEQRLVHPSVVTHESTLDERKPATKPTLRSDRAAAKIPTFFEAAPSTTEGSANRRHSLSRDPYLPAFRSPRMDAMLSFEQEDEFPVAGPEHLGEFEDAVEELDGHQDALPPSAFQHLFTPPDSSNQDPTKTPMYPYNLRFTSMYPTPSKETQEMLRAQAYASRTPALSLPPPPRRSITKPKRYSDSDSSYSESPVKRASRPRGKVLKRPPAAMQKVAKPTKSARTAPSATRTASHHSVIKQGPTEQELAEAKSPRGKEALRTWYERYNELLDYWAEHGHCLVPQKYPPNEKLGVWVNKQRMEKKLHDEGRRSSMTDRKLQLLQNISFQWAKRKGDFSWKEKYDELCAYKRLHDGEDPPTKFKQNPALGRWVSTQRSQYKDYVRGKPTHLTEGRVKLLEDVGFQWAKVDNPAAEEYRPPSRRSHRHR